MMLNNIKLARKPEQFHGKGINKGPFFEGWYFKTTFEGGSLIFIPGIYIPKTNGSNPKENPHAFVMCFRTPNSSQSLYYTYPIEQFSSVEQPTGFRFKIKDSEFSDAGFNVVLDASDLTWPTSEDEQDFLSKQRKGYHPLKFARSAYSVSATGTFSDVVKYPKTTLSPGVMGFMGYVPFLECYHGVCSVRHKVAGKATFVINGVVDSISLDNGHGYIEKDHGRNFPQTWIWLQSHTFAQRKESCFLVSLARVPLIPQNQDLLNINGFLVFFYDGETKQFYDFSLPKGGQLVKSSVDYHESESGTKQSVLLEFKNGIYRIQIQAHRILGSGLHLPGPKVTGNGMTLIIEESIDAHCNIKFFKKDELMWEDDCIDTGMEVTPGAEQFQ